MKSSPDSLCIDVSGRASALDLEEICGTPPSRLEVDIGCGKGRFLVARALAHPGTRFLGIDKRMKRVLKVERKALRAGAHNIRLVCAEAGLVVSSLLSPGLVSAFYLFFPDPWPKRRHNRRRLFNGGFADALARALERGGRIHVATDHRDYFETIHGILDADPRFAPAPPFASGDEERTEFELVFMKQNTPINSCSFEKA